MKSCIETIHSGFEIVFCFATEQSAIYLTDSRLCGVSNFSHKITVASPIALTRLSCLTTSPEILCVVKKPKANCNNLDEEKPLLILDAIRDPGNMGTIIRTADWFGFPQILCSEDCVEYTNPKAIQASMGSFTRTKIVYTDISEYLKMQSHRNIYGLSMTGESIQKQSFKFNDIIIIGSESHGISAVTASYINKSIAISMFRHGASAPESLNAAIAAGIFMYAYRESVNY